MVILEEPLSQRDFNLEDNQINDKHSDYTLNKNRLALHLHRMALLYGITGAITYICAVMLSLRNVTFLILVVPSMYSWFNSLIVSRFE